jgi:hypothetical protein
MKKYGWSLAAGWVLALVGLPCPAQETREVIKVPPVQEKQPIALPQSLDVPAEPWAADCEHPEPKFDYLFADYFEPAYELVVREIPAAVRRKVIEVDYRTEKRTVTEYVIKSREVEKTILVGVVHPITETDSCTGECKTVMKACSEPRTVKDFEYYTVPEERTLEVKVPFLREVEKVIPSTTSVLEYKLELRPKTHYVRVPFEDIHDRTFIAVKPPCEVPVLTETAGTREKVKEKPRTPETPR